MPINGIYFHRMRYFFSHSAFPSEAVPKTAYNLQTTLIFNDLDSVLLCVFVAIFLEALIRKVQVTIKIPLWERLPAAKLNDRGWKPLPQAIQLVLSR